MRLYQQPEMWVDIAHEFAEAAILAPSGAVCLTSDAIRSGRSDPAHCLAAEDRVSARLLRRILSDGRTCALSKRGSRLTNHGSCANGPQLLPLSTEPVRRWR